MYLNDSRSINYYRINEAERSRGFVVFDQCRVWTCWTKSYAENKEASPV